MIEGLEAYPEYKESGVPWLGRVPSEWTVVPIRRMALVQGGKALAAAAAGEQRAYLRVANVFDGFIDARQVHTMPFTANEFERYRLEAGDVLLNEGQSLELVGRSARYEGTPPECAFQNSLIRVRASDRSDSRFLERLFRYAQASGVFAAIATQTTSIAHLGVERLADLPLAFPPLADQRAIVRFLDYADRRIRKYIAAKRKLIALMEEQKRSIIDRAVTRGLDPNVRLKDSGIPWIGMVPEHWAICPLKRIKHPTPNSFVDGPFGSNLKSEHYVPNGEVRVVESGFVTSGSFVLGRFKTISLEHFRTIKRSECRQGDLIIAKIGARYGMSGILPNLGGPAVVSGNSLKLTVDERIASTAYIHHALLSAKLSGALAMIVNATAQPALSLGALNDLQLPLPPLQEQLAINLQVQAGAACIDSALAGIRREVDLLREYRTRLISDVVTGKLDVREAAARLPAVTEAEPDETLPLDEVTDADAVEEEDPS